MKKYKFSMLMLSLLSISTVGLGQEKLTLQQAVETALSSNYQLKVAETQKEIASKNAQVGNAGLLPSVSLNAGADYSNTDTEVEFVQAGGAGGSELSTNRQEINGATSLSYNAKLQVDYVLFDGFGNRYNFRKLKETENLESLKYHQEMESTMLQVVQYYYEVCRQQLNLKSAQVSMDVSRQRLEKVNEQYQYGQQNRLAVLNAEVDLNTDSTKVLESEQALEKAIRNLNTVMGQPVDTNYKVEEDVTYQENLDREEIMAEVISSNASLRVQRKQEEISMLDSKVTNANRYPTISLYGAYGWNQQENDASQMVYNRSLGPSAGVKMSMNLFNGSQQRIKEQNARLNIEAQKATTTQQQLELEKEVANAWTDYVYKKQLAKMEETSVEQARLNFEQTEESYAFGQSNTVEFRAAQENLLEAENRLNNARYAAKISEVNLLQLAGMLLKQ
ncbi:TolC family protein [Limibacter armeniacum]|uniref:TolC family protein n=1 Tax=Limibacter armeniacum TaxID=466084 RepID=UPI002FE524EE